jgi:ABC-type lipoprotein export system ATPase subunit
MYLVELKETFIALLNRIHSSVMTTHNPNAASKAKRTLRLENGRIINGHVAEANKLLATAD